MIRGSASGAIACGASAPEAWLFSAAPVFRPRLFEKRRPKNFYAAPEFAYFSANNISLTILQAAMVLTPL